MAAPPNHPHDDLLTRTFTRCAPEHPRNNADTTDRTGSTALRGLPSGDNTESRAQPTLSIVLPCLNEAQCLPALVSRIQAAMPDSSYEIVFVDDGSDDQTWNVIQSCLRRHPTWQGLRLSRRFGHQSALLAGLAAARGDAVITMDADGQHPPHWIPTMVNRWRTGAKVVQMIRLPSPNEPWLKRVTSRMFYRVFSALCDVPISPAAADFRLLDRDIVDLILRSNGPVPFFRGLIPWLACPTAELHYPPEERTAGDTKFSFCRMIRLALDGLMSFSIVPLRLGIWTGLFFGTLSLVYLCYIALVGLFNDAAVPGWASTAGLVALLGSVQLFCVGLLGEYMGRLYVNSLDRPRFVVREAVAPSAEQADPPREFSTRLDVNDRLPTRATNEALHAG